MTAGLAAGPADTEDLLIDDLAKKDDPAGDTSGPAFLPLRHRPAAANDKLPVADKDKKPTDRRQRPAHRLRFAPDQG